GRFHGGLGKPSVAAAPRRAAARRRARRGVRHGAVAVLARGVADLGIGGGSGGNGAAGGYGHRIGSSQGASNVQYRL
ncbi:hypothetical protein, partial [Burkholderia glumae]|uniref:hypothetical protein n=1 Tax=Burkholderia glumae TaxID=337 RepID=UPI0020CF2C50